MTTGTDIDVRIVDAEDEVARCFPVMRQLRPHLASETEFVDRWKRQKETGYRLLAAWEGGRPMALAGFRVQENLIFGPHLYVDDLVTDARERSSGLGRILMDRLKAEGQRLGLEMLLLDTPLSNALGHRFYFREGLLARALKFSISLRDTPEGDRR
ncbi:GNAT family N-acetyltransferase [Kaustia mangrovi]|uniref:GNAT family N-acetyltransferase n=1 Tax=Kaustia mangrovi TaxID=2593653 RepID=A0A7S8HAL1_9HYPH|nr:GNAT family N-acetyltransferase [Kaustia mangrovi]QPC41549.1 GNAT family N-acetyltransferase [Kaustia mangrovi]